MEAPVIKIQNFINNEKVSPLGGEYLDNYCPATGEVYSQLPDSDERDVALAVESAKTAFEGWYNTPVQERANILFKISELIEKRGEELALAESRDQGKPVNLARTVDIPRAAANFKFFAGMALQKHESASSIDHKAINYSLRKPVGVTGLISPWNLPLYLATWKIAPALAVGNTAVCKPSELTPMTAYLLADIFVEAGLPPGVCNIIFGLGAKAGRAIVTHKDVPLISFTGGTVTAESIIKDSAPHFKKLGLELGGKNPNIIFDDCDMEKALEVSIKSSFNNQGEICLCGSRMFIHENIYDEFIEKFVAKAKALKVGNPTDENTFMGALVSKDHLEKVKSYIDLAKTEGGTVLCGGDEPEIKKKQGFEGGYYLNPTIISGLEYQCRVMQEEIFGPVVTVTKFKSEDEVIKWANSTKFGLSASVWTQDVSRAHRVAEKIDAGTVWVNSWMLRDLRVPFGGMKASGLGREGGDHSIDFYTETKNVCISY